MEQRFTAFISYRHASPDQEVAKRLHTAIETYHIPGAIKKQTGRKQMGKCFRDAEELPLSPDLGDDIERALDNSDWLIAVCTPRYLQSRWCLREMEYFIQHKGRERVLVVLADGEPEESFPEMLLWRTDEQGNRVAYEPLAADVRGATDSERAKKLKTEKLRMLAPILGVGFDDLRRRARQRRIRITATVCAAVVVAGAGLGAYVAASRAKAERLRLEAEEQQRLAAEQARIAEAERLRAVENSIGELLERAASETAGDERRRAGRTLLEALDLSDENGGTRHDEIIAALRRAMYIEPFAPVAGFTGQGVRLLDIVPAPDGRTAVGIENGNSVALIDLEANELRYKVSVDNFDIRSPQFSPDGRRFLAVCDLGRLVTVWNADDGSVAFTYESRDNTRYHIANAFFWGDGDTVLVQDMEHFYLVSADGSRRELYTMGDLQDWYDIDGNLFTLIFEKPMEEIITSHSDDFTGTQAIATPDRSRLLVAGTVGTWGTLILDGEGQLVTPLYGMPGTVFEHYAISDDGRTVACVSTFGFVMAWDGETGDMLFADAYDSDLGYICSDPVFSPDGSRLSYIVNNVLHILDARTGDALVEGSLDSTNITPTLAYSADGDYIFMSNQSLYIIDSQGRLYSLTYSDSPYNNLVQLGDRMLVTKNDGTAYICCVPAAAAAVETVDSEHVPELLEDYDLHWVPGSPISAVQGEHQLSDAAKKAAEGQDLTPQLWYARDGQRAALSYVDGVIEVFEASNGRVSAMLGQLTREITALGMTEDTLVASDGGGRLMIYDLARGEVVQVLTTEQPCIDFAFSAAGDLCMAVRYDGAIDVYDLAAAERLFTMRSAPYFTGVGFSADGEYAVGCTAEGAVCARLWTDEAELVKYAKEFTAR